MRIFFAKKMQIFAHVAASPGREEITEHLSTRRCGRSTMVILRSAALQNSYPIMPCINFSAFFFTHQLVKQRLLRISFLSVHYEFITCSITGRDTWCVENLVVNFQFCDGLKQHQELPPLAYNALATVIRYPKAARMAQNATDASPFQQQSREFYALCPPDAFAWDVLPRSCAPNCIVKGVRDEDRTPNSAPYPVKKGRIHYLRLVLLDIQEGEQVSISLISDAVEHLSQCAKTLKQVYGTTSFRCDYVCCLFEWNPMTTG